MVTSRIWFTAAPQALSFCAVQRATMARGAEARAAMVAAADLRLAEAGVPNPPRHADISRSDLSQPLHPDPRRAEEGADGAVAYCAGDERCCTDRLNTQPSWRQPLAQRRPSIEQRVIPSGYQQRLCWSRGTAVVNSEPSAF